MIENEIELAEREGETEEMDCESSRLVDLLHKFKMFPSANAFVLL